MAFGSFRSARRSVGGFSVDIYFISRLLALMMEILLHTKVPTFTSSLTLNLESNPEPLNAGLK